MSGFSTIDGTAAHAALTNTHGGALQTAAMKNVASGLANLNASRELPHHIKKVASANIRNSYDLEDTIVNYVLYFRAKIITLPAGLIGSARFLFDLKVSDVAKTGYGRIYRNGVALGAEQSTSSDAYVTKSEDITQTWSPGDTCELWIKGITVGTVYWCNFRIAYDDAPSVAVASGNTPG